jgi:hypothetical protein
MHDGGDQCGHCDDVEKSSLDVSSARRLSQLALGSACSQIRQLKAQASERPGTFADCPRHLSPLACKAILRADCPNKHPAQVGEGKQKGNAGRYRPCLLWANEIAKPLIEAWPWPSSRPSNGCNAMVRTSTCGHANKIAHLNGDHRRGRYQRRPERALSMGDFDQTGEDYSQKSRRDENANFKTKAENNAYEKKDNQCHFVRLELVVWVHEPIVKSSQA